MLSSRGPSSRIFETNPQLGGPEADAHLEGLPVDREAQGGLLALVFHETDPANTQRASGFHEQPGQTQPAKDADPFRGLRPVWGTEPVDLVGREPSLVDRRPTFRITPEDAHRAKGSRFPIPHVTAVSHLSPP